MILSASTKQQSTLPTPRPAVAHYYCGYRHMRVSALLRNNSTFDAGYELELLSMLAGVNYLYNLHGQCS